MSTKLHRDTPTEYSVGILLLIVSAVTYSTAGVFTKGVVAGAWAVIFWRGLFAAAFTTLWTVQQGTFRQNFFAMKTSGFVVGVIGAFGTAAFIPAFKLTSIANVALIYAVAPLIAALMAWIAIGEKVTSRTALGAIAAFAGVVVIVSGSVGAVNLQGDVLALIMTIVMAAIMVIYRKYPDTPGAGPSVLQSLFLLPPSFLLGDPFGTVLSEIVILAAFGLLFAIASVTLAEGSKRVPSGQAALIGVLETPLAPVLAFVLLSEVPKTPTFIGGAIIFLAVLFTMRQKPC